jgi:hypothetical protein
MALTVIPTNIGGVSLNSIASPLASLLGGTPSAQNMVFPADLGSNPTMGHAVIFQAYDYKTGLGNSVADLGNNFSLSGAASVLKSSTTGLVQAGQQLYSGNSTAALNSASQAFNGIAQSSGGQVAINSITAAQYLPLTKQRALATISLFMPETMAINYSSSYDEVSMTEALGIPGMAANAYSDIKGRALQSAAVPYATAIGANLFGKAAGAIPGVNGDVLGQAASQALGVVTNPQMQLLYRGVNLREFQLEFILTPKSSAEAQTVKDICDSFAYFSLPGISGAMLGKNSGQFLTPPQVFSVQFQFLGASGLVGQITNTISSALSASGLGFLTQTNNITGGTPSKTFTVNDCVLTDVNIDYAPNGWATYNDGYPVQTRINLTFRETTIYTKENFNGSKVAANYNAQQGFNNGSSSTTQNYTLSGQISNDPNDR